MSTAPSPVREHKLTPRLADAAQDCLLRAVTPCDSEGSQALAWGTAIHNLLKIDTRRRLAGQAPLPPDDLIVRGTPRAPLWDAPGYLKLAHACVVGMRAYLAEEELEVLRAEEFVRTRPRPVLGAHGVVVVLSGRFDLVCRRPDGRLVLPDMKTGTRIPSDLELAVLPSTTLYTLLGQELRRQDAAIRKRTTDDIEIVQVLPHLAAYSSTRLTPAELAAGQASLRELVTAIDMGEYTATPGEWCAYCPVYATGDCPAWVARQGGGRQEF
jgi:hypothetical protein